VNLKLMFCAMFPPQLPVPRMPRRRVWSHHFVGNNNLM
jgi:hypothetical protein